MKQVVTFSQGGKLEFSTDGCAITSISGEVLHFGADGTLLDTTKECSRKIFDDVKHFFFMGSEERELVRKWYESQDVDTYNQEQFLEIVNVALDTVVYDYWIAGIEPFKGNGDKIAYKQGKRVFRGLNCYEWEEKAKTFAPEHGSQLATLHELYLWYAYRVAMGYWSLAYVCDDSSSAGNYWNSPGASHDFEKSGARTVGGFCDGVGNTYKIVKDSKGNFFFCGGIYNFSGKNNPVAEAAFCHNPLASSDGGVGVLVLKDNTSN